MKTNWHVRHIATLALVSASASVLAQQPFDLMHCFGGSAVAWAKTDDALVINIDHRGVYRSNHAAKLLDNTSIRCAGTVMNVAGQQREDGGYCKVTDQDGDNIVIQFIRTPKPGTGTARMIAGTGKWKGVSGNGDWQVITAARPVEDGAANGCIRYVGTLNVTR